MPVSIQGEAWNELKHFLIIELYLLRILFTFSDCFLQVVINFVFVKVMEFFMDIYFHQTYE